MSETVIDRDTHTDVLTVTAAARAVVLDARAGEPDADGLAIWIEANVAPNGAFSYDIYFQPRAEAGVADAVVEIDPTLFAVIPAPSVSRISGATLDVLNDGLVMRNPNEAPKPSKPEVVAPKGSLDGPIAAKVLHVIETQVNPSIASHGGFATLVSVDGDTVYLAMGGGCQGCAMSKATLRQGIEVAIKQHVPEVAHVVDVTDHATGENPYYS